MSQPSAIICPISSQRVNESVVRTVAVFVILLAFFSILFNNVFIAAFLTIDFSLRAFINGRGSLLKTLAKQLSITLQLKPKQVDAAPKKFAAGIGVLFAAMIFVFQLLEFFVLAKFIGFTLIFCALLESAAGICLGCFVYTWLVLPLKKN